MKTLQAIYRTVIMVGTLVVLGMAFTVYGPPPEQFGPLIDRAHTMVSQLAGDCWKSLNKSADVPPTALDLLPISATDELTAIPMSSGVEPAVYTEPAPNLMTTGGSPSGELATIMAELNQLGMGAHRLHRWGTAGELFRFECSVSCPGQPLLEQHFEAVAADAATAVATVASQVRQQR